MSTSDAGYSIGLIIVAFGSAGIICGGWLSDRLAARGASDATLRVGIISALGVAPLAVAIPLMSSAGSILILYAPLIFFCSFGFGAAAAAIQLITPNEMRGQLSAVYLFVINLVGIGLGPPLTGALTDWLFADPQAVGLSIALVAGIAAPTAALTLWWGLPAYRRQYAYISDLS